MRCELTLVAQMSERERVFQNRVVAAPTQVDNSYEDFLNVIILHWIDTKLAKSKNKKTSVEPQSSFTKNWADFNNDSVPFFLGTLLERNLVILSSHQLFFGKSEIRFNFAVQLQVNLKVLTTISILNWGLSSIHSESDIVPFFFQTRYYLRRIIMYL